MLRSIIIFLFNKHSLAARNNKQEPASSLQPASHGPAAMVQNITVWALAGTGCILYVTQTSFWPLPQQSSGQDFRGVQNQKVKFHWGTEETVSLLYVLLQSCGSRKSNGEKGNTTQKRCLSLSHGTLPSVNPEGGISHPPASNTVRASCTHSPRMFSACTYAGKTSNSTAHLGLPLSTVYCAVLFQPCPWMLGKGKCLQPVKLRPSHSKAHRSLLISFPDVEGVFKHCVHNPPNTK